MDNDDRDMNPRISVIMPVWNGEKYLAEAVDSILAQTFTDFELIAVDDGSTDGSVAILKSYRDERLRIIEQGRRGFVHAVNRGVAEAKTDWIARHDADDISLPQRLEKQWNAIEKNPGVIFCHVKPEMIGLIDPAYRQPHFPRTKGLVALKCCILCPVVVGAALIQRSAFLEAGGYREAEFPAEDYAFISRLLMLGEITGVEEALYKVRKHDQQISATKLELQIQKTKVIGVENCAIFLRLSQRKALRAHGILSRSPHPPRWGDLLWFLTYCMPRLRWKSMEAFSWFLSQSINVLTKKL